DDSLMQAVGGQYVVDAQPAPWVVLEAAAAVVEPAEAIGHFRVQGAEAVLQAPALETRQPLAFFRQKAALAGAQPALGVDLANADIAILGRDIEVAHDRHRLIR